MRDSIDFTAEKLKSLKRIYAKAVEDKKDIFLFEGKELVTGYAKYLIEYLEPKFNANRKRN